MKFFIGTKEVGTSFVEVKRKVNRILPGFSDGTIVICKFPKGKSISYQISIKGVNTKKKKDCMAVKFKILK